MPLIRCRIFRDAMKRARLLQQGREPVRQFSIGSVLIYGLQQSLKKILTRMTGANVTIQEIMFFPDKIFTTREKELLENIQANPELSPVGGIAGEIAPKEVVC